MKPLTALRLVAQGPSGPPLLRDDAGAVLSLQGTEFADATSPASRTRVARQDSLELRPHPTDARIVHDRRTRLWNLKFFFSSEWGDEAEAGSGQRNAFGIGTVIQLRLFSSADVTQTFGMPARPATNTHFTAHSALATRAFFQAHCLGSAAAPAPTAGRLFGESSAPLVVGAHSIFYRHTAVI